MALNASTTLPYAPKDVTEAFTDRGFIEQVSTKVGGELTDFSVSGPTTEAFTLTAVRAMPTDRLPELARKVVGSSMKVTQTEQWSAPAADGSRTVNIAISVAGAPVDAKATQKLVAQGDSTVVELEGEVTSSIPFMGKKIAAAAEPYLGKALNLQASQAQAWLDARA